MKYISGVLIGAFMLWLVWASHWSKSAEQCFAIGGTQFDPLGWDCHKHERLRAPPTTEDEK